MNSPYIDYLNAIMVGWEYNSPGTLQMCYVQLLKERKKLYNCLFEVIAKNKSGKSFYWDCLMDNIMQDYIKIGKAVCKYEIIMKALKK